MTKSLQVFQRRASRVRYKIRGCADRQGCPRLSVFRSGKHLYAQIIDDRLGCTLAAASTLGHKDALRRGISAADAVGKAVAAKAKEKKISKVVFDRGGFLYHGCVKQVAEAARKEGLVF